jgi:hypothetical protein
MIETDTKFKHMKDTSKHASYWLRGDLFDDSPMGDDVHSKHANLIALAAYKRAIGNFVSIVTDDNIPVTFDTNGNTSYTDGKSVVISAKMDDKDFDSTVGLALHEGSHVKLTDFTVLYSLDSHINRVSPGLVGYVADKYFNGNTYDAQFYCSNFIKDLINVVEDRRIDNYIYTNSPGYKGYYHAMYDKYFNAKIIDNGLVSSEYRTEDWDSYMFRIINITNENRDLDALPKLREVFNMIDLANIGRLKNTTEVVEVAIQIFELIERSLPESNNQSQPEDGDGNSDGNTNNPQNGSGGSGGSGDESTQDSNELDDSTGDADGDDAKSSSEMSNGSSSGNGRLTDKQLKSLAKALENQKKFQNGNIYKKKISKSDLENVDTLSKAGIDEKLAGVDYTSEWTYKSKATPVLIVRNFTKALVDVNAFDMLTNSSYCVSKNSDAVNAGVRLGTILGKKLKTRNEERSLVTPRMKTGRISGRLLHELGSGNTQIFDQTLIDKHTPALIHISIDASSSMAGRLWYNTQTAAIAIAKAASMTSNLDVVISYRSINDRGHGSTQPLVIMAYDSRKDKFSKIQQLFKYLNAYGTTPEGLCFESILDDIIKTNRGVESYFINFSDGYPGFNNKDIDYSGNSAVRHTAAQVKKIQQAGVKVLSYLISESKYYTNDDTFKKMYGKTAESIDVTQLNPLARTLNKMFQ